MFPPERIVCLTEETVETLDLLGEERRIVGISGMWCARRAPAREAAGFRLYLRRHPEDPRASG